jgi:acetyltransferase-like isoleucine patch superfamily enzyme
MQSLRLLPPEFRLYVANHFVSRVPLVWFRTWFYRTIMGFEIHPSATVFLGVRFNCAKNLKIGVNSVINENCLIDSRGGVEIGKNSILAASTCIITADHDPYDPTFKRARLRAVVIGDHAFIGTRAMILPGARIGHGAMVGAGSIVTRDVPDYTIVAGSPAKPIAKRPEGLDYSTYYRRFFH